MPSLSILGTGRIDERESAFPQAVQLPDGDLLCSFSVGGGQYVRGGTDWARSRDGGKTWQREGELLAASDHPPSANALKLSLSKDGKTIYAYGTRYWANQQDRFGERQGESVFCQSTDNGHSWSPARALPMPDCPVEVSHSIRPLTSGRLLAPGALLADKARLGEEVFVVISDDGGLTWPHRRTVFRDPQDQFGFWEQKFNEVSPGVVMATAWTVTLGDYRDQCNSFCLSHDNGWTWGPFQSTGIRGQTMSFVPLGNDRLLVLYNRRYGQQGVVMALVRFTETSWTVVEEGLLYDAQEFRDRPAAGATGVDELASFQFGFPTGILLNDGTVLVTHWCVEQGVCGIRWTRIKFSW
ncbi:sialidase family protein [Schlesneria sp. T3-172]|uniref:sialidase family protein n=1 Tax=Schlesneria sphaerica TaxID=3373610 RepID=UPI0037CBE46A